MKLMHTSRPARLVAAGFLLSLAGSFTLLATAHPGPDGMGRDGPGKPGEHGGPPPGPPPGGPGGFGPFGGPHLLHLLRLSNVSEAQQTQIRQIMKAARDDLDGQRDQRRTLHEQSLQLFTQPTVDANAVESVRTQMQQQQDQVSRRMAQAMIDVSRVLTPEQRAQIGVEIKKRHEEMQKHMEERRAASKPQN